MQFNAMVKSMYPSLTRSEKLIADYFLSDETESYFNQTLFELSKDIGVGQSTILRFIRKCGFSNLRTFLIAANTQEVQESKTAADSDTARNQLLNELFEQQKVCVDSVKNYVMEDAAILLLNADLVFTLGEGYSDSIAKLAASRFVDRGFRMFYQELSSSLHRSQGLFGGNVVVLFYVNGGESLAAVQAIQQLKHKNATVILVTSNLHSTASKLADVSLFAPSSALQQGQYEERLDGMINQLIITDILLKKCMELKQNNE